MAEQKVLIENKAVPVSETKVKFGALNAPTPLWATWVFRVTFIVTSALALWVAGTQLISEPFKFETMLILKGVDALILGLSKLFGIVEK